MQVQPTYDDVNLILHLYELRREQRLRAARNWFAMNFKAKNLDDVVALCPPGSDEDAYYRMVISYWEMAASFVTAGVLNEDLFFQNSGEMLMVWEKIKDLVPQAREKFGMPQLYRNLEITAHRFAKWLDTQNPGAYAALAARFRNA